MAGSLPKQTVSQSRDRGGAWPQVDFGASHAGRLFTLMALMVVALMAAYATRPTIRIDLGDRFDSAYLDNFNGREIDAVGAVEDFAWPMGQATLTIPGKRQGVWLATLQLADNQPDEALKEFAVAINDVRVAMPRRSPRTLLATIPPELADGEQITIQLVPGVVGGKEPTLDLLGHVTVAAARTYRWSRDESTIRLPGLGRGDWQIDLNLVVAHPNGHTPNAQIFANDKRIATLEETTTMRRVSLLAPADAMAGGDLELTLRSNTFEDPRPLGIFISDVVVTPLIRSGWWEALSRTLPPLNLLPALLIMIIVVYVCLLPAPYKRSDQNNPTLIWTLGERRYPWPATLSVLLLIALSSWALSAYRFPTSFILQRLAGLALWSLVLIMALRPLLVWIFKVAGIPVNSMEAHGQTTLATYFTPRSPFINALILIFLIGYWLKAGGMLYPYFVGIDVQWHMDRVKWILDGRLPLLYGINSPLNESTMPEAEWGANRPIIPYSPYYHMFATLFTLLPFPLAFTANMVSALLDCSRVLLITLLARKSGLNERVALFAGALYAVIPATFLLHSWGNVPTTFGLWWNLLTTVFIIVAWNRLGQRGPLIVLTLLLLATFLFYTVAGVFMGIFLVIFTMVLWIIARRGVKECALLSGLRPLWVATGMAIGLALLIYYGQYIGPIVSQTIPYMQTVFTEGPQSVGVERPSFGSYLWVYIPHMDYRLWEGGHLYYGIAIPLLFLLPGFFALWKRPLLWTALATWFTVALLFLFVGYRISMVDKQVFYMLPAMCICWAIYADRYWKRSRWGKMWIITFYCFSLASAIALWIFRIAHSPIIL